jgi:nitrogen regulatory protein P-II 1
MKELSIIIPHERLNDVNSILYNHKVGGLYFFEISGRGRAVRPEVEHRTVEGYKTGKRYVPEFGTRTVVHVIVSDSLEKAIVSEIFEKISTGSAGDGKIIVRDVAETYDIGSKESGEKAAL